jgi:hypothetical protein
MTIVVRVSIRLDHLVEAEVPDEAASVGPAQSLDWLPGRLQTLIDRFEDAEVLRIHMLSFLCFVTEEFGIESTNIGVQEETSFRPYSGWLPESVSVEVGIDVKPGSGNPGRLFNFLVHENFPQSLRRIDAASKLTC